MPRSQYCQESAEAIAQYATMRKHPVLFEAWPEGVFDPKFLELIQVPATQPPLHLLNLGRDLPFACRQNGERDQMESLLERKLEVC
jgi:hypothetical protein